jgi:predicted MFS family arabinose efflux permease
LENASNQFSGPRASLFVLGAAAFMVASDARVVDPLLNTVAGEFKVPIGSAAYVVSAYAFPYSLGQLIYGPLGDRIGKVRVMALGFTFFAFGTAACAFVPQGLVGLYLLIALRFITGVFAASIIPLAIAYIGDKFSPANRQAMLGQFMSALMLGSVLSGPLGGGCGEYIGWRKVFLVLGGLSMLVMVSFWNSARKEPAPVRDPNKPPTPPVQAYLNVLANPNSKIVYPAIFLEGMFLFGGFVYLSSFLQNRFHLSLLQAGMLISFYGLGGLCYSFTAKRILKSVKQWQMAAMGGVLLMSGFVLSASLVKLEIWYPVIPAALMIGFGFNSLHSTLQTKATELAPKARGTAVSLFAFFFFLGQSIGVQGGAQIGAALGGANAEGKFLPAFWATFITAGVGLFLMSMWVASHLPKMALEQTAPPDAVKAAQPAAAPAN